MRLEEFASAQLSPSARLEHPDRAWQPSVVGNAREAVIVSQPLEGNPSHHEIMTENGYPPEEWELVGDMNFSRRTLSSGVDVTSYRFKVRRRQESLDLPSLFKEADNKARSRAQNQGPERALVVCWADPQTGKVGSRGGTQELIDRVTEKLVAVEKYAELHGTTRAVFVDAGDGVENFESTGQQQFTNDMSLMDQIELEAKFEESMIKRLAAMHDDVTVIGVGSNHCAWRRGKANLGKPSDDWGLFIKRTLARGFANNPDAYGHIKFYEPEDWNDSLVIDVLGTGLGVVHGHQVANANKIPDYWAGQVHGAQALSSADVLVTGHFHTLRVQPTGRSLRTGKSKWWIQAPTLDNGSDWYRNLKGDDSDPGLVVFIIDNEGFNLQSLAVL